MNSPIAVGAVVADTYRIISQLGTGGMGSVFAAEHLRLPGKRVAIKVLHTTMAGGEILLRFRREAEIASRIGHPNIVEVLDFNTLPTGEPFLVMELLAGESLAARLRRGRLAERTALDIARQIGSALDAAHRMQVVHRDLKPDNIFLCPRDVDGELRDHVKVLDFGISKIRNSATVLTQDAAILGTPFYMSPEQASGKNQQIDGRTDIFALGAIVFEMLTGATAFPGDNVPAVIFQVVFQPHPSIATLVPTVNARIVAAVDRALAKEPAARFVTMAEFVEALTGRPLMNTAQVAAGAGVAATAAASPVVAGALAPTMMTPSSEAALAATGAAPSAQAGEAASAGAPSAQAGLARTGAAPGPGTASSVTVAPVPLAATRGPASAKRGKAARLFVAGAAVVVVAGVVAVLSRGRTSEPPAVARPPGPTAKSPPAKPRVVAVDASPAIAVAAPKIPLASQPDAGKGDSKASRRPSRGRTAAKAEPLSPTLLADLAAAEKALAARDAAEAIRRARHSLYEKKTSRAAAILTRAFCLQHDLGAAKAELAHVAKADRARVLRACRAAGLEL
ncbi:MAG: protein kinase [Deltaproteobacteria bacterium]|nr:protein kinase [Deltaproteobacteria bacterium]